MPPPSSTITPPLLCPPALLHKYTTAPTISSGLPNLPFGFSLAIASSPPCNAINPFAILLGKNPGAIEFTNICLGPRSTARFLAKCIAAAFDAEYPNVACSPRVPVPTPATDAVMITRLGSSSVARDCNNGAKSRMLLNTDFTFRFMTFPNAESGWVSNFSPQVAPAFARRMST